MYARKLMTAVVAGSVLMMGADAAEAGTIFEYDAGSQYSSFADSPFFGASPNLGVDFWLEDFEDGLLDTPGVTVGNGSVRLPSGSTDSVDGDDGSIDGFGTAGHSYFQSGPEGVAFKFKFDDQVLGALPTFAGLVWTDGNSEALVTVTIFDELGDVLDTMSGYFGDNTHNGDSTADRFIGATYAGGISAIAISTEFGSLEMDHLQYGLGSAVVPLPPAAALGLAGLGFVAIRRRRKS